MRIEDRIMHLSLWLCTLTLFLCLSACGAVTEKDLSDLKSHNSILKKEAIQRIAKGRSFPLSLIDRFVGSEDLEKAVGLMAGLLANGRESREMEMTLIKSLGHLSRRTEIPVNVLIDKLQDKNERIHLQTIEALGKAKDTKAVPVLLKLMESVQGSLLVPGKEKISSEDPGKGFYPIIWALGEIGSEEAIPYLNRLLASEEKYVKFNAYKALSKIGNQEGQENPSRIQASSDGGGFFDIGKTAIKKYQDFMMVIYEKIAGIRRV